MLLNKLQFDTEIWKPARLVMMTLGGGPAMGGIEREMQDEVVGEKQEALLLNSNEVAGKENPVIKKYLDGVRAKLDAVLKRNDIKGVPDVNSIEYGVDYSEGDKVFRPEARAYRKMYAELLNLAIDTVIQRQETRFNADKEAYFVSQAPELIEKFNAEHDEHKIDAENGPEVVAFLMGRTANSFDAVNPDHLDDEKRAALFAETVKGVDLWIYAKSTLEGRTEFQNMDGSEATPRQKRATEILQGADNRCSVYFLGTMANAIEFFTKDEELNQAAFSRYRDYVVGRITMVDEKVNFNDFKKLFVSAEAFAKQWSKEDVQAMAMAERFRHMDEEERKEVVSQLVEKVIDITTETLIVPSSSIEINEKSYLAALNEKVKYFWRQEAVDKSGLTREQIVALAKDAGLIVATHGTKAPEILSSPRIEAIVANNSFAQKVKRANLSPERKKEIQAQLDPVFLQGSEAYNAGDYKKAKDLWSKCIKDFEKINANS